MLTLLLWATVQARVENKKTSLNPDFGQSHVFVLHEEHNRFWYEPPQIRVRRGHWNSSILFNIRNTLTCASLFLY